MTTMTTKTEKLETKIFDSTSIIPDDIISRRWVSRFVPDLQSLNFIPHPLNYSTYIIDDASATAGEVVSIPIGERTKYLLVTSDYQNCDILLSFDNSVLGDEVVSLGKLIPNCMINPYNFLIECRQKNNVYIKALQAGGFSIIEVG